MDCHRPPVMLVEVIELRPALEKTILPLILAVLCGITWQKVIQAVLIKS